MILEGYGLTETASTTTFNVSATSAGSTASASRSGASRSRSGTSRRTSCHAGQEHVGELVVRGVNVMKGYLDDPRPPRAAFAGGWLHTGDLGYVDEDGFFFIVDRKKDLIIRGGYNVYPREVEEVLYAHPAVAEAAVIGVPDERLGEEVKAFVALRRAASPPRPRSCYVKERVAAYKYPRSVEFRADAAEERGRTRS